MRGQPSPAAEVARCAAAVRRRYPGLAKGTEWEIARDSQQRSEYQGEWVWRLPWPQADRVDAIVRAYARHRCTPYEHLLPRPGDCRRRRMYALARELVGPQVDVLLTAWRRPPDVEP